MKAGKILIQAVFSLLLVLFVCQQIVFSDELQLIPGQRRRIELGAMDTFETIISLWKRERFDEIYEYGDQISRERMSKETFALRMNYSRRLASSWETIRDVELEIVSPKRVYMKAKIGFASPSDWWGGTIFCTDIYEMTLEKEEWRINLRNLYDFGRQAHRGWRGPRH